MIVWASVVGMPCGNPAYVFSAPFFRELRGQRCGVGVGDDLVVVAVHDQDGHRDLREVLGEVGLEKATMPS